MDGYRARALIGQSIKEKKRVLLVYATLPLAKDILFERNL